MPELSEGQSGQVQCQAQGVDGIHLCLQLRHEASGGVVVQLAGDDGGEASVLLCAVNGQVISSFCVVSLTGIIRPVPGEKTGRRAKKAS